MDDEYLADGVYVSHDGDAVCLAVNDHNNRVVYLDREVLAKLLNYAVKHGYLNVGDLS